MNELRGDINSVSLTGVVADTPELRYTGGGTPVCNLRIKVSNSYKGSDGQWNTSDEYFTVQLWSDLAEVVGNYLNEGDDIRVQGRLTINSWEDKSGNSHYDTEVRASKIGPIPQGGGPSKQKDPQPEPSNQTRGSRQQGGRQQQSGNNDQFEPDDELPF